MRKGVDLSISLQGRRGGLLSQIEQDVLDDGKSIGRLSAIDFA
jgi:hypothetical protein